MYIYGDKIFGVGMCKSKFNLFECLYNDEQLDIHTIMKKYPSMFHDHLKKRLPRKLKKKLKKSNPNWDMYKSWKMDYRPDHKVYANVYEYDPETEKTIRESILRLLNSQLRAFKPSYSSWTITVPMGSVPYEPHIYLHPEP